MLLRVHPLAVGTQHVSQLDGSSPERQPTSALALIGVHPRVGEVPAAPVLPAAPVVPAAPPPSGALAPELHAANPQRKAAHRMRRALARIAPQYSTR
jgi:hypothetical protein